MSAFRVSALGVGWLLLLSGSAAFLGAAAIGASYGFGREPALAGVLLMAAGGIVAMVGALPVMWLGCQGAGSAVPPRMLAPSAPPIPRPFR